MIFLVFFLPLSLYCFYLSSLNRAPRAVVISGVWDVVGVLGAISGFLLIGGPAILSGLYEQWRISWLLGNVHRLGELRGAWTGWILLFAAYFVTVITFVAWFILQARSRTSIYNVDATAFEDALRRALDQSSIAWQRVGPRKLLLHGAGNPVKIEIGSTLSAGHASAVELESSHSPRADQVSEPLSPSMIQWQPFESFHHVSLNWTNVGADIRDEIETRMQESLRIVHPPDNPAAGWFFTIASLLLLFSVLTLGALVTLQLLRVT